MHVYVYMYLVIEPIKLKVHVCTSLNTMGRLPIHSLKKTAFLFNCISWRFIHNNYLELQFGLLFIRIVIYTKPSNLRNTFIVLYLSFSVLCLLCFDVYGFCDFQFCKFGSPVVSLESSVTYTTGILPSLSLSRIYGPHYKCRVFDLHAPYLFLLYFLILNGDASTPSLSSVDFYSL